MAIILLLKSLLRLDCMFGKRSSLIGVKENCFFDRHRKAKLLL